ncbi:MAG: sulfatase-like hydrolase/transferase [Desulfuromonadaceae bacterium]
MIIVIDSWRFDMISAEATPNIWQFASNSTVFDQHYSSANATRFGIFSLFYGLYGTYWHSFLAEQRGPVLLAELKKRGYEMGIFASAPLSNPEFDRTVFIEANDSMKNKVEGNRPVDRDQQITKNMLNFINKTNNQPFFGFLFYDAPHAKQFPESFAINKPYITSPNYLTLNKKTDPLPIINNYKNALRFVDSEVGEVLTTLQSKGKLKDTVVLITGDHGEEFNDLNLGYWGHNSNFAQYQTRTPLVLHVPGQLPQHFNHLTTHLDVAPTLMRNLFASTTDPSKYSNGTYLTDTRPRSFVLVSTWASFAMIETKRICIVENRGSTEVVDRNYGNLTGEALNPLYSKTALEEMSRFYKH